MVGTATLSPKDKERMTALLSSDNAMEFMSSEESDEGEGEPATGPPPRHVKPLQWERAKLKNIKAVLVATYQARMTKRQKRTAAKVSRVDGQNVSSRPLPKKLPLLGRARNPELKVSLLCQGSTAGLQIIFLS